MVERIYQRTVSQITPATRTRRVTNERENQEKDEPARQSKKKSEEEPDSDVAAEQAEVQIPARPVDPLRGKIIDVVL